MIVDAQGRKVRSKKAKDKEQKKRLTGSCVRSPDLRQLHSAADVHQAKTVVVRNMMSGAILLPIFFVLVNRSHAFNDNSLDISPTLNVIDLFFF